MGVDKATVLVFLVFLPGILSASILDKLTVHGETKSWRFLLAAFMLGCFSYMLCYAGIAVYYCWAGVLEEHQYICAKAVFGEKVGFYAKSIGIEIAGASFCGVRVPLGLSGGKEASRN